MDDIEPSQHQPPRDDAYGVTPPPVPEGCRRMPCRARGVPVPDELSYTSDAGHHDPGGAARARARHQPHNELTAFFDVPHDAPHGLVLLCSNVACSSSGRRFRFCRVCDVPVARRNFHRRHSHGGVMPFVENSSSASASRPEENRCEGSRRKRNALDDAAGDDDRIFCKLTAKKKEEICGPTTVGHGACSITMPDSCCLPLKQDPREGKGEVDGCTPDLHACGRQNAFNQGASRSDIVADYHDNYLLGSNYRGGLLVSRPNHPDSSIVHPPPHDGIFVQHTADEELKVLTDLDPSHCRATSVPENHASTNEYADGDDERVARSRPHGGAPPSSSEHGGHHGAFPAADASIVTTTLTPSEFAWLRLLESRPSPSASSSPGRRGDDYSISSSSSSSPRMTRWLERVMSHSDPNGSGVVQRQAAGAFVSDPALPRRDLGLAETRDMTLGLPGQFTMMTTDSGYKR